MSNIIKELEKEQLRTDLPKLEVGDTVRVFVKVVEGNRERLQNFEGIVIKMQGGGIRETFTVRRVSYGVGVERTFPYHSPRIGRIEVVRHGQVRRAKLYYLRNRVGKAAKIVEQAKPDVIDINFGCPVKKVAGKGAGAGMLRKIPLMLDNTREEVKAVNVPVTVKTRLGWDCENLIITDLAEQLQDCGIQALTIHGRTRSQMYTGEADWSLIGEVKNNPRIHIPIIGNGDITTPEEAKLAFERYGVDAVMIGRATFGRPWIFKEIRDYLDNTGAAPLTVDEKIDLLEEQLRINVERIDEYRGILHTRRHLAASPIFKGIPDFRQTRIAMLRATTVEELKEILKECRERIKAIE